MSSPVTTATIVLPFPAGTVITYMGNGGNLNGLISLGWLQCNGASVSQNDYPQLYAAIGTTYGGDGNPNFNLPNMNGVFCRGIDSTGSVDPDYESRTSPISGNSTVVGPVIGSRQGYQVQNHVHTWWNNFGQISASGSDLNVQLCQSGGSKNPNQGTTPTTNNDGGGDETRPTNVYVYYLIFTGLPQTS